MASLDEDPFGKVAADVSLLIRTYVSTIRAIEGFIAKLDVHWTDVERVDEEGREVGSRKVEGVDEVVAELKKGLKSMLEGFGKFATELGMDSGEVSIAKEVAGKGVEMEQVT